MTEPKVLQIVFACFVLVLSNAVSANPPYTVEWGIQAGSSYEEWGTDVAIGPEGQVYVCGRTKGDFVGSYEGNGDVFLCSYSADGGLNWSRQFGTAGYDNAYLDVDAAGNVYVTGQTSGSMYGTNQGGYDAYVRKYSDAGDIIWTQQFGTPGDDWSYGVATDPWGNVYFAGNTTGAFGVAVNEGMNDFYLTKLDSSGNHIWTSQTGSTGDDWFGGGMSVDEEGNVYVTGITYGNLAGANAGGQDLFVLKYDRDGNQVWGRQEGTGGDEHGRGIAVDGRGNVFVCGLTSGSLEGESAGSLDAVVLRYDMAGNLSWIQQFGSTGQDKAWAIAADGCGNAFVTGETSGKLGETDPGYADGYITMCTELGNVEWTSQLGSSANDGFYNIAMTRPGEVCVVGTTWGDLWGDSSGDYDFVVAKLIPEPATLWLLALGGLGLIRRRRS